MVTELEGGGRARRQADRAGHEPGQSALSRPSGDHPSRGALLALAEGCENESGPNFRLDTKIAMLVNGKLGRRLSYTASLDAAMTLYVRVPERVPADPRKAAAEALRQRAEDV